MSTPNPLTGPLKFLQRAWPSGIQERLVAPASQRRGNHHELGASDESSEELRTVVDLPVNPLSLNFRSQELEHDYRVTVTRRYTPYIRIAVFLSTSLIIWFASIDWYYMPKAPDAFKLSLILRVTVMLPAALLFFFFTFNKSYETKGSQAAALAMLFINCCWIFPTVVGGSAVVEYFSSAMIQTLLFGTFLLNIRFVHVFVMSWTCLGLYWIFVWISDIPLDQKVYVTIELGVINQMLCFALYMIERLLRQSYYQRALIEQINLKRVDWLEMMTVFLRHELKNKIVGIRSTLELVQRKHPDEQTQKYLRRGITNINTMSDILSHTSEATSIEASLYTEKREIFELGDCLSDQIEAFGSINSGNAIVFERPDTETLIYGIEHRIQELFENLLFNALDHASPGSKVIVRLSIEAGMARVSVTNQGDPLPPRHEALYELFKSKREYTDSDNDNDNDHIGLGLYLVRLIANVHDGSVHGMNLADRTGVEFSVYLPLAANYSSLQLKS